MLLITLSVSTLVFSWYIIRNLLSRSCTCICHLQLQCNFKKLLCCCHTSKFPCVAYVALAMQKFLKNCTKIKNSEFSGNFSIGSVSIGDFSIGKFWQCTVKPGHKFFHAMAMQQFPKTALKTQMKNYPWSRTFTTDKEKIHKYSQNPFLFSNRQLRLRWQTRRGLTFV